MSLGLFSLFRGPPTHVGDAQPQPPLQGYPNPQGSTMLLSVHNPWPFLRKKKAGILMKTVWLFRRLEVERGGHSVY